MATIDGFSDDELMTRAAALAFYAALSVAPVLLLLVWLLSMLHPGLEEQLSEALRTTVGEKAASSLESVITSAHERPRLGHVAGIVGLAVTLFSASAVFAQLQGTLDRVWRVKPKPGAAVGTWLRARARAFALLGGVAFLLIVSLVASAVIQAVFSGEGAGWTVVKYAVSILVFMGAFTLMFRLLPDASIDWSDALLGAVVTTLLFLAGEFVIGLYVAHSDIGGAYGPAGAFVVLLTWTYYSSLIVLIGAELTRSLADARGKPIRPSAHAVQIEAAPAEVGAPGVPGQSRRQARGPSSLAGPAALITAGVVAGLITARSRRPR
ncbi:YihY/virulence factor BrkB family protein [Luteibacter aegosomaticola]|uniref:YihY/virulence factor BrkB family protein n=1 Tax=Luteibacter aegosomaticola TaxID=2911538 RepID=UPI001FF96DDB|nr:YihY/virulence factor BrkB family protein [Luteibacter aegosomaticola]UPG88260.1 YihY/virulence factor BrkB family protein [Luteibacter aegosomaticola]